METRTRAYKPLIDERLNGTLDEKLRSWFADGENARSISTLLLTQHEQDVPERTVARWLTDLGLKRDRGAA